MALIKYGAGIVQMSGSIAGSVFARNRFGNYARPRTKPVNPHSVRQEGIRTVISFLAEYWHTTLTATERGLWNTYAAAIAMQNKLGEQIFCTGFNHFIRTNAACLVDDYPMKPNAPSTLSLADKDPTLGCSAESIATQTFTFTFDDSGWGNSGDLKHFMLLYQGQPQLVSRSFFNGPWRYMGKVHHEAGSLGTDSKNAAFAFAAGQKVWFMARILTVGGRLSKTWMTDPKTIEAD